MEADGTSSSSDVFHFNRFPHLSPGNHPTMTSDQLIDEQCPGRRAFATNTKMLKGSNLLELEHTLLEGPGKTKI